RSSTWSRTQPGYARPAPRLGQHTREVLAEAGLKADEIEALIASGAAQELEASLVAWSASHERRRFPRRLEVKGRRILRGDTVCSRQLQIRARSNTSTSASVPFSSVSPVSPSSKAPSPPDNACPFTVREPRAKCT